MHHRPRYLFVRILEACDADCFMCHFALSKDPYRLSVEDLDVICSNASQAGFEFVRFSGGEPLIHPRIFDLVRVVQSHGLRCSLITNGGTLSQRIGGLADAGLEQVIVSLDAASASLHNRIRATEGLFERAVDGLQKAVAAGLRVRVNSVVGPHNYREMPILKRKLAEWGVDRWELSALKLDRRTRYRSPEDVLAIGREVYDSSFDLVPMGVPWYGATPENKKLYFEDGIPARPSGPSCHVTQDVVYLDAKHQSLFACSCLPHRDHVDHRSEMEEGEELWKLDVPSLIAQREYYFANGPRVCTGCSATAAGYSDDIEAGRPSEDWDY